MSTCVDAADVVNLLERQLALPTSSWSIGVPGAIAEFHRTGDDDAQVIGPLCLRTTHGALRITPQPDVQAHAYEILSARPNTWHHGIVLSLTEARAVMNRRRVVTEIGPDTDAVRSEDRSAVLFDLGLGFKFADFYVRTSDPAQIALLRGAAGTSLLRDCCALYDAIVHCSPHRVFVSSLARIEIYQRIGGTGSGTPHGPHTHLLPRLFRPERTHLSNIAVPAARAPCLTLYPANPILDEGGARKPFNSKEHEAFQNLLATYGEDVHVQVKDAVRQAVVAGLPPHLTTLPSHRRARIACRIALRQLFHVDQRNALAGWQAAFEPASHSQPQRQPHAADVQLA